MATKTRKKKWHGMPWCQRIVKAWEAAGNVWPAPSDVIAEFAIANGLWETHKAALIKVCAREISKAMAQDYIVDEFGRPVRRLHSARIGERDADGEFVQKSLWGDIRTMDHDFMATSFQQRRCQIVGECRQLQNDIDFYNRKHPELEAIQFVFDFTDDVTEGNMPTEYRPPRAPQKG
jgi:hypothetical protein